MPPGSINDHYGKLANWQQQVYLLQKGARPEAEVRVDDTSLNVRLLDSSEFEKLVDSELSLGEGGKSLRDSLQAIKLERRAITKSKEQPVGNLKVEPEICKFVVCTLDEMDEMVSEGLESYKTILEARLKEKIDLRLRAIQGMVKNDPKFIERQLSLMVQECQKLLNAAYSSSPEGAEHLVQCLRSFIPQYLDEMESLIIHAPNTVFLKEDLIWGFRTTMLVFLNNQNTINFSSWCESQEAIVSQPQIPSCKFYIEHQKGQNCGPHAANAFFGEKVITDHFVSPVATEKLVSMMQREISGNKTNLDPNTRICEYTAVVDEKLYRRLDNLKNDRVIIYVGLRGHYVAFRQDEAGQWYKLDSSLGYPVPIKPGEYLRQVYKDLGQNSGVFRDDKWVAMICQEGENNLGMEIPTIE